MTELCFRANAKINLFLEVLDQRPDGYHNIETIFQSIDLHDIILLRVSKPGVLNITSDHPQVPTGSSNLVYKAGKLLLAESGKNYGAEIQIIKQIPIGAGLAGGSTDAAATLIGLNELWRLGYSFDDLLQFAGRLGSDVPFCMIGGTALGRGRGELLTQLNPLPQIHLVVANPGFQVSTAWAYRSIKSLGLTRTRKNANIFAGKINNGDLSDIGTELFNVFESVVMGKYPVVRRLKESFIRSDALGTLMTGSGPTVFAIARDISNAQKICKQAKELADFCIITNTSNYSIAKI